MLSTILCALAPLQGGPVVGVEPCEDQSLPGIPGDGLLFGSAVALSGGLAVIGNPEDSHDGFLNNAGSVFLYYFEDFGTPEPDDDIWAPADELVGTTDPGNSEDRFGAALAIGSSRILIGVPGRNGGQGAVYDYAIPAPGTPIAVETTTLEASDTSTSPEPRCYGCAIAYDPPFAAVGASKDGDGTGAVYIYEEAPFGAMVEIGKITPADFAPSNPRFEGFGSSLVLKGGTLVVGSPAANLGYGQVTVFEYDGGGSWVVTQQLRAPAAPQRGLSFGASLAQDGNTLIIGAPGLRFYDTAPAGAAYVYRRPALGVGFVHAATLMPSSPIDATVRDLVGASLAISGDKVLLGAPGMPGAAGKVFSFDRHAPGDWQESGVLTPNNANVGDRFGFSVAVDGDTALIGAPFASAETGGVFVFSTSGNCN